MKKILLALLFSFIFIGNSIAAESFFGTVGNRINLSRSVVKTNTLIKNGGGEIWRLDFQATSSTGTFTICDDTISNCGTLGSAVVAEGGQATSGNSYAEDFGDRPVKTSTGIYAIVSNGTLIVTYD